MAEFTLTEIVKKWGLHHGKRIDPNERLAHMIGLVKTLKEYGYGKEYNNSTLQKLVLEICTNEKSKKYRIWSKLTLDALDEAFILVDTEGLEIKDGFEEANRVEAMTKSSRAFIPELQIINTTDLPKLNVIRTSEEDLMKELGIAPDEQ